MQDFENHLLPGMQDRYNILWVEHIDKGRLELNFVIPKIDLESQKSLNPYYHKADLKRVELWQDLTNLENSFTNPKDPAKARTLETNSKELHLSKDYETLDKTLHELVNAGALESRADIIELLQKNNIEVTRTGADYLAIKLPESKKANDLKEKFIMNNLQALENLTKSANEKSEKLNSLITEILNKRLESLEQNLTNTHKQKLNTMESDLREIIKKKNYLQISITAILTAVITIALLWTVSGKQYNEQTKETFYYIKTKG